MTHREKTSHFRIFLKFLLIVSLLSRVKRSRLLKFQSLSIGKTLQGVFGGIVNPKE